MLRDQEGRWVDRAMEIKLMILDFYKTLFKEDDEQRPIIITNSFFPTLEETYKSLLLETSRLEEIGQAIFTIRAIKAPRERWFSKKFLPKNWHVVAESIIRMIEKAFNGQENMNVINQTFLVLILKIKTHIILFGEASEH